MPGSLHSSGLRLKRHCLRTLLRWSLIVSCSAAGALDPTQHISQYAHTAWRIQDGFFSGTPQAITQTADGYLWIGTEAGLVRFDGVRFVPWVAPPGKQLPSTNIHSLLGARDGSLWIGTSRGLAKWNQLDLVNVSATPSFIETILQDAKGTVWVTRSQVHDGTGPLCEVSGDALHCYGASDGILFAYAQPLFRDSRERIWIGSSTGLLRWSTGEVKTYLNPALMRTEGLSGVNAIASEPDGALLVGMRQSGQGLGLRRLLEDRWEDYDLPGMRGAELEVAALLTDRNNGLWVGTGNRGIYRIHGGRAEHFGSADGLSSDSVQGFYEDREGNVWVATSRGIDRFHETRVVSFSIREGLTSEDADSVLAARDGTVWIGNLKALDVLRHGELSAIQTRNGLPGHLVTSLFEDYQGRLWVGVDSGLTVHDQGQFRAVNKPDGKSIGVITAITEDVDHNIWAASTQPALFRIQDLQVRDEIPPPRIPRAVSLAADPKNGVWLGLANGNLARLRQGQLEILPTKRPAKEPIHNLLVESDGSVWAATSEGVLLWRDNREQILDSHNGLACDDVYTILRDNRGSVWLDTRCGLIAIDASELNRWWQQPDAKLKVRTLDVFDGAQPGLTNFRPEASKSPDGKLWFTNENILQMVDPEHLSGNRIPPPVHVEQIIADRKAYSWRDNLQLPARTRDIEIDYTALSLVVPEKVRFRYKLEGHDSDWQDPQTRRQAFYNDLPPGNYRFHVVASNNDGVWNEVGATSNFTILPAFFQTAWFRLSCILAGAAILWLLYALRLRRITAGIQARFEERLEERARIARDLHDTLLQGIFSASLHFDLANNRLPPDSPAKSPVERGIELLKQVAQEGRNALRALRTPQTDDDLEQALLRLRQEFALPESISFRVVAEGQPRRLRPHIRDEVYLIAREAVLNAFRHSHGNSIEVEVDYISRNLRILIRDNGCGIDAQVLKTGREGHWGLASMRERAEKIGGALDVLSSINAGTEIQLRMPGKLAFQTVSPPWLWRWVTKLYPSQWGRTIADSNEERRK